MDIYGKALAAKGYTVNYKPNLGNREIVRPALASGQIDFYPGYAATGAETLSGSVSTAPKKPIKPSRITRFRIRARSAFTPAPR